MQRMLIFRLNGEITRKSWRYSLPSVSIVTNMSKINLIHKIKLLLMPREEMSPTEKLSNSHPKLLPLTFDLLHFSKKTYLHFTLFFDTNTSPVVDISSQ